MIILGLGSNLDWPLENLRTALKYLREIPEIKIKQISSVYMSDALLPANSPPEWQRPYLNLAISLESNLSPTELLNLIKAMELKIGRKNTARWAPRIIDIDILAWDDLTYSQDNLHIPHKSLLARPFALLPLLEIAPKWQHPSQSFSEILKQWQSNMPFNTKQIPHRVDTPTLVGILNTTPDSFSDGGLFNTVESALKQAINLFNSGAEIIDIGAESTRPNATPVYPEKEWQILSPILQAIADYWRDATIKPKICVDTRNYQTAIKAINLGIDWLNDQTGLLDPIMQQLVAETKIPCIIMHNRGIPECRDTSMSDTPDIILQIKDWTHKRLDEIIKNGAQREQIIFDPGIGFGKNAHQSLLLLNRIQEFKELNMPLLVGHSRKSFMGAFTSHPAPDRDLETAVFSYYLSKNSVDYLRVHNAEANTRALKIAAILD